MKINKQHLLFLLCWVILLLPNIATMILSTDLTYSLAKEVVYLVVVLVCLFLPATFLRARTYFIIEGVLALFWAPIEMASLSLNHMTVAPHFMAIIFETNRVEAFELLGSVWPLLILIAGIWVIYWWAVVKIDNQFLFSSVIRKLTWIMLPILAVGGVVASLCILPDKGNGYSTKEQLSLAVDNVAMKFHKIYPFDIYIATAQYRQEQAYIQELNKQLETFDFGITPQNDTIEEHYIVIIGEAARYDHFHFNGYARATSPYLDTIPNVFSMSHWYSQANLTRNAVSLMVTRADLDNRERAFQEKSIVEAFAEAGYQTAWLSCQTLMDFEKRIAQTTDFQYEQVAGLSAEVALDSILPYQAGLLFANHPARKTFFLLHPMGSHLKYDQRYSAEYERFTPAVTSSDGYAVLSVENKSRIINAYDNTILYTDYVIGRSINLLRQQSGCCALIYVSDHGENLFDDGRNLSVHGSYEGTIYEAHVPCFVWVNDAYRATYPDKVAALQANLHTPVSHDVLFYSLADMADIAAIVDSTKSIYSPYLVPQDTVRMLTGNNVITSFIPDHEQY
ncbi:MAG: phosphoethanolamine transferase [Paludibacteraceae bacterium]|nr:phosphoethanolamine transferase [Paludibacteraceae bacterium]